jgi:hypothetical protein
VIGAVLALALGGGCITPSIPIPPPEPTAMTFQVDVTGGTARFTYRATQRFANAVVYVFNQDQGTGIIDTAGPDGSVGPTQPFPAVTGDQVLITFELEDQAASTCVLIRDGTPLGTEVCE